MEPPHDYVWVRVLRDLTPERFNMKKGEICLMDRGRTIPGYYTPMNPDPACRYVVYQEDKDVEALSNAELITEVYSRGRDK